jgi:hypothetical protein
MSDNGEHLGPQTRRFWRSWVADQTSGPYEGTAKHPQGRLFAPLGSYTGDPWKLSPENWLKQSATPAHGDIISWHSSEEQTLPRSEEYEHRQLEPEHFAGADWGNEEYDEEGEYNEGYEDYSTDTQERPMAAYGSAVGMHFGDLAAASQRAPRPFIHPARIPKETLASPPRGSFSTPRPGGMPIGGEYKSNATIVNKETGEETKDTRWSDVGANFAEKATDLVERGKTLAYRNEVEARGSTSYRTLPETARTWSEDVLSSAHPGTGRAASKYGWTDDPHAFRGVPHPVLVHLAESGYDPVIETNKTPPALNRYSSEYQLSLPFETSPGQTYEQAARVSEAHDWNAADISRRESFNRGKDWTLRRPS